MYRAEPSPFRRFCLVKVGLFSPIIIMNHSGKNFNDMQLDVGHWSDLRERDPKEKLPKIRFPAILDWIYDMTAALLLQPSVCNNQRTTKILLGD